MLNTISGTGQDDFLAGSEGGDLLLGLDGHDFLSGADGDDTLVGGRGDDFLSGGRGSNRYLFERGDGHDRVVDEGSRGVLQFGAGIAPADILATRDGEHLLLTLADSGESVLLPVYFAWFLSADNPDLPRRQSLYQIRFDDGMAWDRETVLALVAPPVLLLGEGNDIVGGVRHGNGGAGDDQLLGTTLNDVLLGGAGNDHLIGFGGDDLLDGGAGNDTLEPGGYGEGVATLRFVRGWGQDQVLRAPYATPLTELKIEGVLPASLSVSRSGAGSGPDLILSLKGSSDSITLRDFFHPDYAQPRYYLSFDNGTRWQASELIARLFTPGEQVLEGGDGADQLTGGMFSDLLSGGAGDDRLDGGYGDDVLVGGSGFDVLIGGEGDDTLDPGTGGGVLDGGAGNNLLLFGREAGNVQMYHYPIAHNTVLMASDVAPADVRVIKAEYGQFNISIANSPAVLQVLAGPMFGDPAVPQGELNVVFADGSVWDTAMLIRQLNRGDGGDNVLTGSMLADTLYGLGGNDQLFGLDGDDALHGGAGNDRLVGGDGADLLVGGAGDDELIGNYGNDIYLFARGDGVDTLFELSEPMAQNVIRFAPGISRADVTLVLSGPMLQVHYGAGDLVHIGNFAPGGAGTEAVSRFEFADGSVFSYAQLLPAAPPLLQAAVPNAYTKEASSFSLAIPANTFIDPQGQPLCYALTLADGAPLPAWLAFDPVSRVLSGKPADADTGTFQIRVLAVDPDGLSASTVFELKVDNINQAPQLAYQVNLPPAQGGVPFSFVLPADMFIDPDAGDTGVLSVPTLPSWLSFNAASRTLYGTPPLAASGSQLLLVAFKDGKGAQVTTSLQLAVTSSVGIVQEGGAADDVLGGSAGADTLSGGAGNDSYRVDHVADRVIELAGAGSDLVNASVSYALPANVENLSLEGSADLNGAGNALDNVITGNSGNNLLDGAGGSDTLSGGAGNDTYIVRGGERILENAGAGLDRVLASVSTTLGLNLEVLVLTGAALTGSGNALDNLIQGNGAANSLNGLAGIDLLQGGAGNDNLNDSSSTGNLFDGGAGNDAMNGGSGREIYVGGSALDTISPGTGADIVLFNRGDGQDTVLASQGMDNTVSLGHGIAYADLSLRRAGSDLVLGTGAGEQVTFKNWYAGSKNVSTLQVITEGGADYQPGSGLAIKDNKIEQFDFAALVARFDAAPGGWTVASALAAVARGGSDTLAIGGAIAYTYAIDGDLGELNMSSALAIIGSPAFGNAGQAIAGGVPDGSPLLF